MDRKRENLELRDLCKATVTRVDQLHAILEEDKGKFFKLVGITLILKNPKIIL